MSSVKRNGIIVSLNTLISRCTGFLREVAIAKMFGTSVMADIINVSFRLPNLFRRILGEGAASQAFVPIYCTNFSSVFFNKVFTYLFIISTLISITLVYFMDTIFIYMVPGLASSEHLNLGITSSRISSFYLIFIVLSSILGALLNAKKKFFEFAFMPVIANIIMIIGIFCISIFDLSNPLIWLSITFLISGLIQLIFMVAAVLHQGIKINLDFKITTQVKKFFKNLIILSFGTGAAQINIFISQGISSTIPGCIAIINYADRLYQLPISILTTTLTTILLTELSLLQDISHNSKLDKNELLIIQSPSSLNTKPSIAEAPLSPDSNSVDNIKKIQTLMEKIIVTCLLITIPCGFGLMALSKDVISFVYYGGAFNHHDVHQTSKVLFIFSSTLPAVSVIRVLSVVFYSKNTPLIPTITNIISMLVNLMIMMILIDIYGYLTPAISAFSSIYLSFIILTIFSIKHKYLKLNLDMISKITKFIISGTGMYFFLKIIMNRFLYISGSIMHILLHIILGIIVYYVILRILNFNPKNYI